VNNCWPCRRILFSACLWFAAVSPSFSQTNKSVTTKTFPLSFEINRGQISPDIQFVARAESLVAVPVAAFGCGGSSGGGGSPANGTPAGTYTIIITGSSGGANQTVNLSLTVQ